MQETFILLQRLFYFNIPLKARLQLNTGFTLRRVFAALTRSAITMPKVNRLGWNWEHSEYIIGGWPWQILGAIHAVVTAGEPGKFCFFCQVSNAWFHRFPVSQISQNLNSNMSIGVAIKTFGTQFSKFYHKGRKNFSNFLTSCNFRLPYFAMTSDCWKFTTKITLYGISSFHFYHCQSPSTIESCVTLSLVKLTCACDDCTPVLLIT